MLLIEENKGGELVQKARQPTLKLALAFSLKLHKKMETMDKEVMCSFYYGKSMGWKNLIQDISNSLHEAVLEILTSKMELGANQLVQDLGINQKDVFFHPKSWNGF